MPNDNSPTFTICPATCDDARAIGEVHLSSWRTTYRGIGIDDFLDNHTVEQRVAVWKPILCNPESKTFVYVAEIDGRIVGFAAAGPERSDDAEYEGELYALYLLQDYQRQGIGRKLLRAAAERLVQSGVTSMLIWVLAVNPARYFYEACGGQAVREKPIDWGGKTFDEIGYGWSDLSGYLAER
jgi:GNAT superfamily N-acetyltransferase